MFNSKPVILVFISLLLCATSFAQPAPEVNITGLWTGLMYNDTTGLNYRYEIAISEKNGNYSGYSHTFFILDGKEYYGVKKIRVTVEGNKVITQDIKLLDNNYPIKPPKGVYMINVLHVELKREVMMMSGLFETNYTKKFHPVTGYVHIEKKTGLNRSSLLPQLEALGLAGELSFVQEEKAKNNTAVTGTVKPEETVVKTKPAKKEKAKNNTAVTGTVKPEETVVKTKPAKKEKAVKETKVKEETAVVNQQPAAKEYVPAKPAANIRNRIVETIQSVNYRSDSLLIALYDNGEVDGDTVSVLLNGEVIMANVGLSTQAVRKTIYTKDLPDSVQIVMYAETLGSLPPNTGLLVVYDGAERYEIRFSGDLQKNAAIVFKRKKGALWLP